VDNNKYFAPLVLFGIFILTCANIIYSYQFNDYLSDELVHLVTGLQWWQTGNYNIELLHPPLNRAIIASLPYFVSDLRLPSSYIYLLSLDTNVNLFANLEVFITAINILLDGPSHLNEKIKTLMRLTQLPFVGLLMLGVYIWLKEQTSKAYALVAVALLFTIPTMLCWSSFAMTDLAPTALSIWALYWINAWVINPKLKHSLYFGIFSGLAFCCKFSTLPFIFLALGARIIAQDIANRKFSKGINRKYLTGALVYICTWTVIILAVYNFSFHQINVRAFLDFGAGNPSAYIPEDWLVWVPADEFICGIIACFVRNSALHPQYFLGKIDPSGSLIYFPVMLFFKTPLTFTLLLSIALYFTVKRKGFRDVNTTYPLLTILVILILAMSASINIGIRHLLLIYPLIVIYITIEFFKRSLFAPLVITAVLQLLICLYTFPNYLSYYNVLAGPNPEYIAIDSNYDNGQKLGQLAAYLKSQGIYDDTYLVTFVGQAGTVNFYKVIKSNYYGKLEDLEKHKNEKYYLVPKANYILLTPEDKEFFDSLEKIPVNSDLHYLYKNTNVK
jgi:4-amino-4-deoxy-L-arabinose transferase-like glycosyltransferase